ncbi:MAG: patatin-like phospholipase family protein [Myxococcota bacterium]|nr:patatin-like phospholipase family protein [Myxococcota bacterium]
MKSKKKIAIACQGGGSHTAFTAGVLKKWLLDGIHKKYDIVGLSGTSGGAICAALAWFGLLKKANGAKEPVYQRLVDFWEDNQTNNSWEQFANDWLVGSLRLQDRGWMPAYATSPYNTEWIRNLSQWFAPRKEFVDLQALIEKHLDFEEAAQLATPRSPRLLLGAVDVLNGTFKAFDSREKGEINVQSLLASSCIPKLFKAVRIGKQAYWDGLFSQNPPISNFIKDTPVNDRPDEIRIIQINPTTRGSEPETPESIIDRRNELAGNLSMFQEIEFIKQVNKWIQKRAFSEAQLKRLKPIDIRVYTMDSELADGLDFSSKLDRSAKAVQRLFAEGEACA